MEHAVRAAGIERTPIGGLEIAAEGTTTEGVSATGGHSVSSTDDVVPPADVLNACSFVVRVGLSVGAAAYNDILSYEIGTVITDGIDGDGNGNNNGSGCPLGTTSSNELSNRMDSGNNGDKGTTEPMYGDNGTNVGGKCCDVI
jgi:hypothetical protein